MTGNAKTWVVAGLMAALTGCGGDDDAAAAGADLKCMSSNKNAFDTFGAAAFVAVNEAIIANVGSELAANGQTNLGNSFGRAGSGDVPATRDDLATFKGKLAAFLVYTYGGPDQITYSDGKSYQGKQDMAAAHTGLGITGAQYDYFLTNAVVPALTANGVTADDVSSCFAPPLQSAAFKASIVGK